MGYMLYSQTKPEKRTFVLSFLYCSFFLFNEYNISRHREAYIDVLTYGNQKTF